MKHFIPQRPSAQAKIKAEQRKSFVRNILQAVFAAVVTVVAYIVLVGLTV